MLPSPEPKQVNSRIDLANEQTGLKIHPNFYIGAAFALTAILSFDVGKSVGIKEGKAMLPEPTYVELPSPEKLDLKSIPIKD